jgi:hypothetical protein
MVACTYLHENEKTNVTDKDLLELLQDDYFQRKFVVKEVRWTEKRLFRKAIKHVNYSVYYRYDDKFPFEVQHLSFRGGPTLENIYAYFMGIHHFHK